MRSLRTSLLALIIGLSIFFNIERIDFAQENTVDMDSFVYVFVLAALVLTFSFSPLRPTRIFVGLTLWTGVYVAGKWLLYSYFDGRPLIGGMYTYLTVTEIAMVVILMWLAYRTAFSLKEFEDAVEKITFSGDVNSRVHLLEDANESIQVEMFRSRHNHYPLGVIVCEPELGSLEAGLHKVVRDVQKMMVSAYIINNMANTLSKYLRRSDFVLENRKQGRFVVVCPDTKSEDLPLLAEYIQSVAQEQLETNVVYGFATFPDEAITFEELVSQAETRLSNFKNNPQSDTQPSLPVQP